MNYGVYFHLPYCIKRCSYCDFVTYESSQLISPELYTDWVHEELLIRKELFPKSKLESIYFGGGTPSLFSSKLILSLINGIANLDIQSNPKIEITLEVNPGTITYNSLDHYLMGGVNRISFGVQTFDDHQLKLLGRTHSSKESLRLIKYAHDNSINFNIDLLFGLPQQTFEELKNDLNIIKELAPPHISAYNLTLPKTHLLYKDLPHEELQIKMYESIRSYLNSMGYSHYEISNYAIAGSESKHNQLYWQGRPYLGFGLAAHSYLPLGRWGVRFWNPSSMSQYRNWLDLNKTDKTINSSFKLALNDHFEYLEEHQALTEFCYTSLRTSRGLKLNELRQKFNPASVELVLLRLSLLEKQNLINRKDHSWSLKENGELISNRVFEVLTFLSKDIKK